MADLVAKQATKKQSVDVVLPLTVTETKHILKNDLRQVWQLEAVQVEQAALL